MQHEELYGAKVLRDSARFMGLSEGSHLQGVRKTARQLLHLARILDVCEYLSAVPDWKFSMTRSWNGDLSPASLDCHVVHRLSPGEFREFVDAASADWRRAADFDMQTRAGELIGIGRPASRMLFSCDAPGIRGTDSHLLEKITVSDAVKALMQLHDEGVVSWDHVCRRRS